ncbi:hypothetical protein E4191_14450 [Paracoccus liaowanqingii]|uniref:Protein ImuA n=1 Tax=Paracoccus liaowanqingii TaxID=2560053 RepID=A0A4P7HNB9_9RHOB|nr:hypothetical protein [Paracoccus liaowanqingii]QBX35755.1 hypothetical protein E4191_14450 [Paracoccus liaowanqingii]
MTAPDADPPGLAPARIHEAEGPGRHVFAIFQALRHPGPVFWIRRARCAWTPFPGGLPPGLTARLQLIRPQSDADLLWATEEALRARVTGFVLAEPERPLSLTAGRRLQLAAEAGRTTGLMLIGQGAGSNATESRWHCAPLPAAHPGMARQRWTRIKNKRGLLGEWLPEWPAPDLGGPSPMPSALPSSILVPMPSLAGGGDGAG